MMNLDIDSDADFNGDANEDAAPEAKTPEVVADPPVQPEAKTPEIIPPEPKPAAPAPQTREVALPKPTEMLADEQGVLRGGSLEQQWRLAQFYSKARVFPRAFDTTEKCLALLQYCYENGLKPVTSARNLMVVNNTISEWGDLPLKKVRDSGLLAEFTETPIDKDYKPINSSNKNLGSEVWAYLCRSKRKDTGQEIETYFTMDDAKRAGLLGKDTPWKGYPRRMLQMRARSQNLKDNFGDILAGTSIVEYDHNIDPSASGSDDSIETTSRPVGTSSLNEVFAKKPEEPKIPLSPEQPVG